MFQTWPLSYDPIMYVHVRVARPNKLDQIGQETSLDSTSGIS
jgi:hypothetical protein